MPARFMCAVWLLVALQAALLALASASSLAAPSPQSVYIQHLAVSTHPDLVIDTHSPQFSWQLPAASSAARGVVQSAYQLQLSAVKQTLRRGAAALSFDTGRVQSNESRHVVYRGPSLASDSSYDWRLRYWTTAGLQSDWAQGRFRTALFSPAAELNGSWIGHDKIYMNELRREFDLPQSLTRATAFISAAGYYELYLNGKQVDPSRRLDPGYTLYEKDMLYVSFDLTEALTAHAETASTAAVGVRLGDGWYSQQQNPPDFGSAHPTYGPPRLLFQLNMQSSSGEVTRIVSDVSWTGREGTVTASSPFMGENYSARKERPGWAQTGFTDPYSLWTNAIVLPSPLTDPDSARYGLRLQTFDPIRAGDAALHIATSGRLTGVEGSQVNVSGGNLLQGGVLHPISISQANVGAYLYDLGQTFSGTCTLTLTGVPAAIAVSLQHAEVLRQPGANGVQYALPDTSNLRGAVSTDLYVTKGEDGESYTPAFTVHGFRYFTVYGLYNGGQIKDVTCNFIHSETTVVGNFTSSNAVINQIQHNVQWGQLSNMMSVPTDCPQRDERRGWSGDAALSADETLFNFDFYGFYTSWLVQWRIEQGDDGSINDIVPDDGGGRPADPNWGSAFPTITWQLYDHYGDITVLQENYAAVRAWIDCMHAQYNQTGLAQFYYHYGDWVPPPPYGMADSHLVSSFAFLRDVHRVAMMASILNLTSQAVELQQMYAALTAEFHTTWYRDTLNGYSDGSQAANTLALALPGLVPANLSSAVLSSLVQDIKSKGQFTTGIVSIAQLFPLLSSSGHHDLAVSLAQKTTYPSYGYEFTNPWENATTIWEVWDAPLNGGGPAMDSRNHHMYASIGAWFYRYLAGIQLNALSPIVIRPRMTVDPTLLPRVHAEVVTRAGPVVVSFVRQSADVLSLQVTVPSNTQARLVLEALMPHSHCVSLTESGSQLRGEQAVSVDGVSELSENVADGHAVEMTLLSGQYHFEARWALLDGQ